jgi:hypothetical protein
MKLANEALSDTADMMTGKGRDRPTPNHLSTVGRPASKALSIIAPSFGTRASK